MDGGRPYSGKIKPALLVALLLIAVVVSIGVVWHAGAVGETWTSKGPAGAVVKSLRVSPSWTTDQTMFVGAFNQIHETNNAGGSWIQTTVGTNSRIESIAFSPAFAVDQTAFIAGDGGFWVKYTTNGGTSWTESSTIGIDGDRTTWDLAVSPGFAADNTVFVAGENGVHKSTNRGVNFTPVNIGLPSGSHYALAISPSFTSDQTIFVGTSNGIYKSTNGGTSWTAVNDGIAPPVTASDLAISPNFGADQTIFACISGRGVFRSTNGGTNWVWVNTEATSFSMQSLAISPNYAVDRTVLVGGGYSLGSKFGIFTSQDAGNTWTQLDNAGIASGELTAPPPIAVVPNFASVPRIFIGTANGVYALNLPTELAYIEGQVVRSDNLIPIANVTVRVSEIDGNGVYTAVTDNDGNYRISYLPADCYFVQALPGSGSNFQISEPVRINLRADEGRFVDFELRPGAANLNGTVRDGGVQVEGALIEYENEALGIELSTPTDSAGFYSFTNLPPGEGFLRIHVPAGSSRANTGEEVDLLALPANNTLDFGLAPGFCVTGRVLNQDGDPMAGILVDAESPLHRVETDGFFTNASGVFNICNLPAGIVKVEAVPGNGFCDTQGKAIYIGAGLPTSVGDIRLQRCTTVQGAVNAPNPDNTCGLSVEANGYSFQNGGSDVEMNTYQVKLPAGTHTIFLDLPGGDGPSPLAAAPVQVTVSQAQVNSQQTVTVPEAIQVYSAADSAAATISGNLTKTFAGDDPEGELIVAVLPLGTSQAVTADAFARTQSVQEIGWLPLGPFSMRPVPPGTYDVAYVLWSQTAEGLESATVREWRTGVVVPDGGSVSVGTFDYASAGSPVVSGYVYDTSGNPVVGARVMISSSSNMLMGIADTNQNGYWVVYNLPAGTNHIVRASSPFFAPIPGGGQDTMVFNAVEGVNTAVTTTANPLRLSPFSPGTGTVRGTVRDSSNNPITGTQIRVQILTGNPCGGWQEIQEAYTYIFDGTYTAAGLAPGNYWLKTDNMDQSNYVNEWWAPTGSVFDCSGAQLLEVSADTLVDGTDFQLDVGSEIRGTVYQNNGTTPITGVPIEVRAIKGDPCGNYYFVGATWTDTLTGNYSLKGIPAGSYFLVTDSMNQSDWVGEWWGAPASTLDCSLAQALSVASGTPLYTGINFQLDSGVQVSGSLYQADGTTLLTGDMIQVDLVQGTPCGGWKHIRSTQTFFGSYTLRGILPGVYQVRTFNMSQSDYVNEWWASAGSAIACSQAENLVLGAGGATGIDFQLDLGASIRGTVYDSTGQPITGVNVSVDAHQGDPCGYYQHVSGVWTDPTTGAYAIRGLPQGNYYIRTHNNSNSDYVNEWWASAASAISCSQAEALALGAGGATGINFQLDLGASIRGTVYDSNGQPVTGVPVNVIAYQGDPCGNYQHINALWTDPVTGAYAIRGLPIGNYYIRTDNMNMSDFVDEWWGGAASAIPCGQAEALALSAGGATAINFQLDLGGSIRGTVKDSTGQPVTGVSVNVNAVQGDPCSNYQHMRGVSTDPATGAYAIRGLPQGNYYIRTDNLNTSDFVNEWFTSSSGSINCSDSQVVGVTAGAASSGNDFRLDLGGSITGTVTNGTSGIPNVCLNVISNPCSWEWLAGSRTDASGNYTIHGVPAGNRYLLTYTGCGSGQTPYYIDEWWNGQRTNTDCNTVPALVVEAGLQQTRNFVLELGGRITGQVTANALPLNKVCVSAFADRCWQNWTGGSQTEESGEFTIRGLPVGDYFVVAQASCENPQNFKDEWYDNLPTTENCNAADPVFVTAGADTPIAFSLNSGFPIEGALKNVRLPNGNFQTTYEVTVNPATFAGSLPDDIVAISISGPNGPLPYTKANFQFWAQFNTFILAVDGSPAPGTYTFTTTGKDGAVGTASDYQYNIRALPVFDNTGFKPAAGSIITSKTPSFTWTPIVFEPSLSFPIFYRLEIYQNNGGTVGDRVFASEFLYNQLFFTIPPNVLSPGTSYFWRVRAADNNNWIKIENHTDSEWIAFTTHATLTHPSKPVIHPGDWLSTTWKNENGTAYLASVKVIDLDGVSSEWRSQYTKSHTLTVTGPSGFSIPASGFSFDSASDQNSVYFSANVSGLPSSGNYTFTVADPDGNPYSLTEYLDVAALPVPDKTTITPSLKDEFITATIDNVLVNGLPYDNFDAGSLDYEKWSSQSNISFSGGKLVSSLSNSIGRANGGVGFVHPENVNSIQADITVTAISPSDAPRARISGAFCNNGRGGDIFASLSITRNSVRYSVSEQWINKDWTYQWNHLAGWNDLAGGELLALSLGTTVRAGIAWNGTTLTFTVKDTNDAVLAQTTFTPVNYFSPQLSPLPPPMLPEKSLQTRINLTAPSTNPTFAWGAVSGANRYRLRIYDYNNNHTVWQGYPGENTIAVPPGILKPNSFYRYRLDAWDSHSPLNVDNVSRTPASNNDNYRFYAGVEEAQQPFIDLDSLGVYTRNGEGIGEALGFWIHVHDAQGVPGNIQQVTAIHPGGFEEPLTYVENHPHSPNTPTRGVYAITSTQPPVNGGTYRFRVQDKDGNSYETSEVLTSNPLPYALKSSLLPVNGATITGTTAVNFDWADVPGALFYQVNIYDYGMTKRLYIFYTSDSQFQLPEGFLPTNNTYRWRVHARREYFSNNVDNQSYAPGKFSEAFAFTLGTPTDTDGDGMPDFWEDANGLDRIVDDRDLDPDGDGLTNLLEFQNATNPKNPDTDGDGFNDGREVAAGKDPLDSENFPAGVTDLERAALIAIYNSMNGPGWTNKTGWNGAAGTECTWYGVTCTNSHVAILNLNTNNLTGQIPPEIGNLSALWDLRLHDNQLTGPIPSSLAGISALKEIRLMNNQLTGGIPPEFGSIPALIALNFSNNQLTGGIPAELGNLATLQRLRLAQNKLTGSIPPELGNLLALQIFELNQNQLSGPIPSQLVLLTSLLNANSDFRWNALYTDNTALRDFLNLKQIGGNWESTQTVVPTNIAVNGVTNNSATLSWTPIAYTADPGGYEVYYSTQPTGPYTLFTTTGSKTASGATVTGLNENTKYYFKLRTVTNSHANNQNTVYSRPTNGGLHAMYVDGSDGPPVTQSIRYLNKLINGWSALQTPIGPSPVQDRAGAVSVAVDQAGIWHAVYTEETAGGNILKYKSATTIPATLVADQNPAYVAIAVDKNGKLHVMYTDGSNGPPATQSVKYMNNLSGSWSTPQIVAGPTLVEDWGGSVSLTVDQGGTWHAVYIEEPVGTGILLKYKSSVTAPITLVADPQAASGSIAVDPNGKLHVMYVVGSAGPPTSQSIMYLNNLSGSWSTPQAVVVSSPVEDWGGEASIGVDQDGRWHVFYMEEQLAGQVLRYANASTAPVSVVGNVDFPALGLSVEANPIFSTTTGGAIDTDGDGLTDAEEATYGTNPNKPDTDGDGFSDLHEVQAGTSPTNSNAFPIVTALYLQAGGSDLNLGDASHPLKTLHKAVERANASPEASITINLAPGVYNLASEGSDTPVVLGRNMTINGSGAYLNGTGSSGWAAGLTLAVGAEKVTLSGLTIQNFKQGLAIQSSGGCIILNNIAVNACETGIELAEAYQLDLDLTGSVISGCGIGVKVTAGSSNTKVRNGELFQNNGDGIRVESSNQVPDRIAFEDVRLIQNAGHGIVLYDGTGHSITGCLLTGNNFSRTAHGAIAVFSTCTHVNRNQINGNQCAGVYAPEYFSTSPVDATENFWGSASGPSGAGPGTGDAVSEFVAYDPWLGMTPSDDTDYDGLPDAYEQVKFGNLQQTAEGDFDGDGWSNLAEYQAGTAPDNKAETPIVSEFFVGGPGAKDHNLGTTGFPLKTLHGAVKRVNAIGGAGSYVIKLGGGIYSANALVANVLEPNEPAQLGANATIIGAGKGLTILDGGGVKGWAAGLTLAPTAGRVLLDHMTLRNFKQGLAVQSDGGCVILGDVEIKSCETGIELAETYQLDLDLGQAVVTGCGIGVKITAGSSNVLVRNGEVRQSSGDGIRVESSNATPDQIRLEGILVLENAGNGVALYDGAGHTVTDCTVAGNNILRGALGGIAAFTPCTHLNQNVIEGNRCLGLYADDAFSSAPLDATSNWWGHDSGPFNAAANPAGTGDAVSDNAFFEPWLGYSAGGGYTLLVDSDNDQLIDPWEQLYFGDLNQTGSDDYDQDGLTNKQEQDLGYNPNSKVDVAISQPAGNPHYTGVNTVVLAGSSNNAREIQIRLNGNLVTTLTSGLFSWSATLPVSAGNNAVEVTALEQGGPATSTAAVTVVLDDQAPTVSIETPFAAQSYVTSLVSLAISGLANDNSGVAGVSWTRTAAGEPTLTGEAFGTASWLASAVPLVEGKDNFVTVTAKDLFGNESSTSLTITREPQVVNEAAPPPFAIAAPKPDPLDIDGDGYQNEDETACGGDPADPASIPANHANSLYPADPSAPYFNPDKLKRDSSGNITGSYRWPNCLNPDDDRDGMPDVWEVLNGLNPLNAADADLDPDGDGITNLQEFINGTNPNQAPPQSFQIEVLDEAGQATYDTWLPGFNRVLKVRVSWTGGSPPEGLSFELKNTTSYPGRAVNDPDPAEIAANGYPVWYLFHGPDFGLTPLDPAVNDVHSFDQGPITVNGAGEYIVYVQCWDFGGRTRLVATHPTDPAISAEVWIPMGSGANGIGSAWIHDSADVRLNPNADIDAIVFEKPGRFAPLGDGYNNLQDYRGIVYTASVGGPLNHLRLNPFRKDLFVRPVGFDTDYPFAMGNALLNAGIDVHNLATWGHDATEDGRFFRYHRQGTVSVSGTSVNGTGTGWSTLWPEGEWEFKLNADSETAWTPISRWSSAAALVLERPYAGGSSGDYAIRKSMPQINVLVVRLDREKAGVFPGENGHIVYLGASPPNPGNLMGSRFWAWTTKGLAVHSSLPSSYGIANVYKIPLDHYFSDKPYAKNSVWDPAAREWTTAAPDDRRLMPLSMSEDPKDALQAIDGFYDLGLSLLVGNQPNGAWDGDRRLETYADWDNAGRMNPFDINGDGFVELPIAQDPNANLAANQQDGSSQPYNKARVLKHSITHEICHILAKNAWHSFNERCVMYKYSNNWKRDDYLSDEYRELLQIHNFKQ